MKNPAQVEEYLKEANKIPEAADDQNQVTVEDDLMTGDSQNTEEFDFSSRPVQPFVLQPEADKDAESNDQLMELGRSEALPPFEVMEEL